MKILSVSDVITNSSSEVFIIDKADLEKLSPKVKKEFEVVSKENFLNKLLNFELDNVIEVIGLPDMFACYNFEGIQKLREVHTDEEIVDFLAPLLNGILDKAIFEAADDDPWEYSTIETVSNELCEKNIQYVMDRV